MSYDIKSITEVLLAENKDARNSDMSLFYHLLEKSNPKIKEIFTLEEFKSLPCFTSISRSRRKFQSEGFFLAEESVQENRELLEQEFRKGDGY